MSYVIDTYDYLHSIPEIGWQEYKTSAFLAGELEALGFEVRKEQGSDTGLVAVLDSGNQGPVLALRADMDALEFEGEDGKYNVHACGHDAHSAMVLAAGKIIKERGLKKGKLYLVFQPAEEVLGGAMSMIEAGAVEEVEEMFGIHLRPIQEAGTGQATPGLYHGASYRIEAQIKGLNAHGARPHLGINAVDAAVQVVSAINAIRVDPLVPHSIKVTRLIAGGDTVNLIPDRASLAMDLRAQTNEVMEELISKARLAIEKSAEAIGAEAQILFVGGVPGAEYDAKLEEEARLAIEEVLGQALAPIKTVGGEDFHFYSKVAGIRTAYIGLGCGLSPGLHHPEMGFDKEALKLGRDILVKLVDRRLGLEGAL